MSKRARGKFASRPRDMCPTSAKAVAPLLEHLNAATRFYEPCVGSGDLAHELVRHGHICVGGSDIEPSNSVWRGMDALDLGEKHLKRAQVIITNPPWSREIMHPMIEHFRRLRPTWMLIDADWMHTRQAAEHLVYCQMIVSVGRVSWMGNGTQGFDNCAWYLFDRDESTGTVFIGR